MNKLFLVAIIVLTTHFPLFAQTNDWSFLDRDDYYIHFPSNWEADLSGDSGTEFFLLSELTSKTDPFKENLNLMIQNLEGLDIDLDAYVEISELQIVSTFENGKVISSQRIKKNGKEFHKLIYSGSTENLYLKWEQHYYIKDEKAYVLTLTCSDKSFKKYKKVGEQIFDSFIIKE